MPNDLSGKSNKKSYYVKGMHCPACELLIKQDVETLKGVAGADVSLDTCQLIVHTKQGEEAPSKEKLNSMFAKLGYSFYESPPNKKNLDPADIGKVLGLALLFAVGFYLFEKSGIITKISVTSQSSLLTYFLFGIAAGLSSCAALVGGLLLSLSKKWNEIYGHNRKKSLTPFILFNVSRLISFAILGGLLGLLGGILKVSLTASAVLALFISVFMLILGAQMIGIKYFQRFKFNFLGNSKYLNKNTPWQSKYVPILVGALTFFIPCGFTLIAQTNALGAGSFWQGASQLLAFALGTLPILALISFTSIRFFSQPKFNQRFSLFAGFIIVFFALYNINSQLNVLGWPSLHDLPNLNRTEKSKVDNRASVRYDDQGRQIMRMEATGFNYYPKDLYINANTKTKWEIDNKGVSGCAAAVYGRGLYSGVIFLKPGLNVVEFTSPAPGTYKVSCSMGMVQPISVHVL